MSFPDSFVIQGATVLDGTGKPSFSAGLRVKGDTITEIGDLTPEAGEKVLNMEGMVVAPGFIDLHNHSMSTRGLKKQPELATQVAQGLTTIVLGPDGTSQWPISEFLDGMEKEPAAVNVATFVGHSTLRTQVMGPNVMKDLQRPATEAELKKMKGLLKDAMEAGVFGLSTGLEYLPAKQAPTEEVVALARVAASHGGSYKTHVRNETDDVLAAHREAIQICKEAGIPTHISHIKMGSRAVWGKAKESIALIVAAREQGHQVTADCYPYAAWLSTVTVLVPNGRYDDPVAVKSGMDDAGGAERMQLVYSHTYPQYSGKRLSEIAEELKTTPTKVLMHMLADHQSYVIGWSMQWSDIEEFYHQPFVTVASDGGALFPHPRGAGSFARVLSEFVRDKKLFSLEEAVRKMSSAPARVLGLTDRGSIEVGMKADLVIFDPEKIEATADYDHPMNPAKGVIYTFVNGRPVWHQDKTTGERAGRVLRHSGG
jgi:N-acyl-D-amino-acid deacylase